MNVDLWLTFVPTVVVVVLIPGPSVLLVAAHGATHGFRPALATIGGDLSANALQMFAATIGLGLVLQISTETFGLMKWAGVGYLLFLGVRILCRKAKAPGQAGMTRESSRRCLFTQGFMVSAMNPKALIFFFALFPQFLDPARAMGMQFLVLAVTVATLDGLALLAYTLGAARLNVWLRVRGETRWPARISGALMLCASMLLALKHLD